MLSELVSGPPNIRICGYADVRQATLETPLFDGNSLRSARSLNPNIIYSNTHRYGSRSTQSNSSLMRPKSQSLGIDHYNYYSDRLGSTGMAYSKQRCRACACYVLCPYAGFGNFIASDSRFSKRQLKDGTTRKRHSALPNHPHYTLPTEYFSLSARS